eukprot:2840532-Rhodomonas_salina.2
MGLADVDASVLRCVAPSPISVPEHARLCLSGGSTVMFPSFSTLLAPFPLSVPPRRTPRMIEGGRLPESVRRERGQRRAGMRLRTKASLRRRQVICC